MVAKVGVADRQVSLLGGLPEDRERAALSGAERLEEREFLGSDCYDVAFLALVAPELQG